jgi:glycosyltransferase involved in cell wall biosynthesis
MPSVSLTMIVRNEEAHLPACLESCADLFDELVVVDTGSTDRTKEIAAGFGARVFDFAWCDDFSAARNESLRHATGEWVFWMDADDRIDSANRHRLRWLLSQLDAAEGLRFLANVNVDGVQIVPSPRLTPRVPGLRWTGRIHEQLVTDEPLTWADAGLVIEHIGYRDPALMAPKLVRNLRLLELSLADNPHDCRITFLLGHAYFDSGRLREAYELFKAANSRIGELPEHMQSVLRQRLQDST